MRYQLTLLAKAAVELSQPRMTLSVKNVIKSKDPSVLILDCTSAASQAKKQLTLYGTDKLYGEYNGQVYRVLPLDYQSQPRKYYHNHLRSLMEEINKCDLQKLRYHSKHGMNNAKFEDNTSINTKYPE